MRRLVCSPKGLSLGEETARDREKPVGSRGRCRRLYRRRDRQEIRSRWIHVVCRAAQRRQARAAGERDRGGRWLGFPALAGRTEGGRGRLVPVGGGYTCATGSLRLQRRRKCQFPAARYDRARVLLGFG